MRSPTDEYKMMSDLSGSDILGAVIGAETFTKRKKRKKRNKKKNQLQIFIQGLDEATVNAVNTEKQVDKGQHQGMVSVRKESRVTKNNSVFRKLLRRARYFDPPGEGNCACRNCGEEGHREGNCGAQKRRRPCYGCGNLDHGWRRCKLRRNCFCCKGRGHFAKDCPHKSQGDNPIPDICLRCGDTGHDMFSCCNDYSPRDIEEMQCYICKSFGHLCCADSLHASPRPVLSCFNCGQSGHLGSGCMKTCEDTRGVSSQPCTTGAEKVVVVQENS